MNEKNKNHSESDISIMNQQAPLVSSMNNKNNKFLIKFFLLGCILVGLLIVIVSQLFETNKMSKNNNKTIPTASISSIISQPQSNVVMEKKYIDLYGIELEIPKGWVLVETNRRMTDDPNMMSLYSHDCADYKIESNDHFLVINLRPACIFFESLPNPYPKDAVILETQGTAIKNSSGDNTQYFVRLFNRENSTYEYTYGYKNGLEEYDDMTKKSTFSDAILLPSHLWITSLVDGNGYYINNDMRYSGPEARKMEYIELADKIVLSLKVINNTISAPPTPTPFTASWKIWKDQDYGFTFKYPESLSVEKEILPGEPYQIIHLNNKNNQTLNIQIYKHSDWEDAGFQKGDEASYENNKYNFSVGGDYKSLPAWKYDPPLKEEEKRDQYLTDIYFATKNNVIHYLCQHDWDLEFRELCLYQLPSTISLLE